MEWTHEQQQAIIKNKSNILVAAAAGSGKTAVLVERIINKILNEKIDIDKLLVVTFTNAAASEMRERILNAIYKKIDESENDEEIQNLQKQVVLINKASICTIDSFCLDVVRNNFFEIDSSPNFRIADTAEIELLKQEVLEELFEEKYEEQNEDFQSLIKTYTSYRDDTPLKELILKIYSYISSSPYPKKWLDNAVERFNIEDKNIDFTKTVWGELLIKEIREELQDDIAILEAEIRKLSVEKELILFQKTIENDIYEFQKLLANLDNWNKAYSIANSVDFITWPRNKVDSIEKENAKNIRDSVKKKFKAKVDKIFVSSSEEATQDILEMYKTLIKLKNLIFKFDELFTKKKKDKNIVDFSDVEHYALQILVREKEEGKHERTDVAKKYMHQFEEIAIDEYQDSNLVQEYILTAVSRGNNIFMVGDIKQSIYKFRQARPELFLEKYKTYSLDVANDKGLKIQLFKNFRSRENILDFTNTIFANIMSENLGEIDYSEEEYLNLGANWGEKETEKIQQEQQINSGIIHKTSNLTSTNSQEYISNAQIEHKNEKFLIKNEIDIIDLKEKDKQKDYDEDSQQKDEETEDIEIQENLEDIEIEAKFVAKKIKELVDSKFQVYDIKEQKHRNIKYRDIAILLRSTKGKAPIFEKELIEKDIPVYSDMSSEYIDTMEIQTILSLLKIIDNPMQDIPLVTVMRSSIGKFTDNELVEIRLADQYSDFYTALQKSKLSVSTELKEKIDRFLADLDKWREEQEYLSLDELIWKIYEDTGFLNYMGVLPNGMLRQENLKMLFERAKQYESASFKGLFNFIRFIERLHSSSGDLSSAKMIGENEDVVRIMSIHKSKGLEFPIVFLASSSSQFNLMDLNKDILLDQELGLGVKYIDYDMQVKYDTLTKLALRNKELNSVYSEEMRILYVALTRAKEKLYITGLSKDFSKAKENMENMISIYQKQTGNFNNKIPISGTNNIDYMYQQQRKKINPLLIKKYKTYLDWILMVYYSDFEKMKDLADVKIFAKDELIKDLKPEEKQEIDLFKMIEENCKNVTDEEVKKVENELSFEYEYMADTVIPSKTSITAIAHKNMKEVKYSALSENEVLGKNQLGDLEKIELIAENKESDSIAFPVPKFLNNEDEEKVSASKRGTIMHLCMKNLDFSKDYELKDVEDLVTELKNKEIITSKEADSVNLKHILQFTKSDVWQELQEAKEYHKEEPFYINVSANEIEETESKANILAQGIIDLYYIDKNDNLVLLDYKTDFVKEGEEEILIKRHTPQLLLYKKALENALDRKVDKIYIYSTTLGKKIQIKV
ncbi:MAG: UvrD-helicase domain-containing protein [Clostridia bacterium]|nr:UvrD-helicase domain-containing protein [Clostridia bacterium]